MIYSLSKLLSEEPEKLEALILNFLKILVAMWFVSLYFSIKVDYSDISNGAIPKGLGLTAIIRFTIVLIIYWFVIWWLIGDVIIGGIVLLFAKIGTDKNSFLKMVDLFSIGIVEKGRIKEPEKGIIDFYPVLGHPDDGEYPNLDDTRLKKYFSLLLALTIIAFISNMFHWAFLVLAIFVLLNLFVSMVVLTKIFRYYKDNKRQLIYEFGELSYIQLIRNAVNENDSFKEYEIEIKPKKIFLLPKKEKSFESIEIEFRYHWNTKIGYSLFLKELENTNIDERFGPKRKKYGIIVSNLESMAINELPENEYFKIVPAMEMESIFHGLAESVHKFRHHYKK